MKWMIWSIVKKRLGGEDKRQSRLSQVVGPIRHTSLFSLVYHKSRKRDPLSLN